jgi:predicted dehydrogenase
MRIGIIGTGRHGARYANHIVNDVPGLELSAICRRSAAGKAQAEEWRCEHHTDWQQLVEHPAVEAVIGVVPPALNLAIARACVKAKKPLLLEKPLASSLEDANEISSLFKSSQLPLTVGQTLRYNQVIQLFRRQIHEIGHLYSFSANQRLEPSTLDWHEQPELAGAGVSFHTAVHVFDALRYITGLEIERVMAVTGQHHNGALEDMLLVLVEMAGGVKGMVDCSKVGAARSGRFEFVGEKGQLVGDQIYNICEQVHHSDRIVLDPGEPVGTIVPFLRDWHQFLSGLGPNPVSGDDGLKAVAICDACLRSARNSDWVKVV